MGAMRNAALREIRSRSTSACASVVEAQQSAEAVAAMDGAAMLRDLARLDQIVADALVRPFVIIVARMATARARGERRGMRIAAAYAAGGKPPSRLPRGLPARSSTGGVARP